MTIAHSIAGSAEDEQRIAMERRTFSYVIIQKQCKISASESRYNLTSEVPTRR